MLIASFLFYFFCFNFVHFIPFFSLERKEDVT